MNQPTTVRARVLRDFNDAGTERNFIANTEVDVTPGELANYRAGGLVEPISTDAAPSDATTPAGDTDGEAKKSARRS